MKKIFQSIIYLCISVINVYSSNIDIFIKDNKIQYTGSIDSGTIKNVKKNKNGRYIQNSYNLI